MEPQTRERPSFLLIITDQQRADTLGVYGSSLGATPTLDALASSGVTFRRGYCNNPLCMPSRASILTGRYPSATGVRTNGCVARPGQPLLPELLAQAGYHTAAFGKVHYHPASAQHAAGYWPENRPTIDAGEDLTRPYLGFQRIALACGHGDVAPGLHARELREHHPDILARRGPAGALEAPDPLLQYADKIQTYKTRVPVELYPTTWVTDRTIEHLEQVEEPFFVWCGINDPHHPFKPPGRYWHMFKPEDMPPPVRREGELDDKPPHFRAFHEGRYRDLDTDGFLLGSDPYLTDERVRLIRAAYYGMVALIDDSVKRMIDALERRGLRQNTVVIYVTDHGELLGDHGFVLKGPMHYESLLRVPYLWNGPNCLASEHTVDGLAGLIDLFPTILDLAGVPVPAGTQGKTLIRQLRGESDRGHHQLYVENDADVLGLRLRTLITERWKLTWTANQRFAGQAYGEIYDLEEDPHEFVNLWDRCDPAVKHDLVSRLLETVVANQDTLPPKISHA
jgi:arylsulfatase